MKAPSRCPLFPGFLPVGIGISALRAAVLQLPFAGTSPMGTDAVSSLICTAAGARKGSRNGQNHWGSRHSELLLRIPWCGASLGVTHD